MIVQKEDLQKQVVRIKTFKKFKKQKKKHEEKFKMWSLTNQSYSLQHFHLIKKKVFGKLQEKKFISEGDFGEIYHVRFK